MFSMSLFVTSLSASFKLQLSTTLSAFSQIAKLLIHRKWPQTPPEMCACVQKHSEPLQSSSSLSFYECGWNGIELWSTGFSIPSWTKRFDFWHASQKLFAHIVKSPIIYSPIEVKCLTTFAGPLSFLLNYPPRCEHRIKYKTQCAKGIVFLKKTKISNGILTTFNIRLCVSKKSFLINFCFVVFFYNGV